MQDTFSDTAIKLRSKIIPLGGEKKKLEKLLQDLKLKNQPVIKLDVVDKANVDNMIRNVKNACENFMFKKMHQDYKNINERL